MPNDYPDHPAPISPGSRRMTRLPGPTATPGIGGSRQSSAGAAADWRQAIDMATALLREGYALSDTMDDPIAAAQAVSLAATLCAYGMLSPQRDSRGNRPPKTAASA
jgi:hypothetical protein